MTEEEAFILKHWRTYGWVCWGLGFLACCIAVVTLRCL